MIQTITDDVRVEADRLQAVAGDRFTVAPNGAGLRAECTRCGVAATHDRAYRLVHEHRCQPSPEHVMSSDGLRLRCSCNYAGDDGRAPHLDVSVWVLNSNVRRHVDEHAH